MLEVFSPAKINLFFQVFRKRGDGYHDIFSLYQAIDLFDRLFFSFEEKDSFTCSDPLVPLGKSNLILRAVSLFRQQAPVAPLCIHLEKKIPMQSGLGGGSSNAAATLWALNEMTKRPLSLEQLSDLGADLGSDVPFFFSSGSCYTRGRGELLEPCSLQEEVQGFIAKPDYGLSTPHVYQAMREEEMSVKELEEIQFVNDLEKPAFRLEPRLKLLKEELLRHFKTVSMTGSGTAFFCLQGTPPHLSGVSFFPFRKFDRETLFIPIVIQESGFRLR